MAEWGPFEALDTLGAEELRKRLESLRAIIERAPVPIAIAHDPECRFISANRALASLLRLPTDANISLTPLAGDPGYRIQRRGVDMPREELPMQYAIAHRTSVSNEIEIVRADGSVLYVQNDVEPLYDTHGRIYGCVSVCVDITDRMLAETALRDADRRKDEFLATLSHELRNPLAPLRTALELMRIARDDRAVVDKARATMERQLLHLVRITDDLLDVSRITQNKVEFRRERIDLRAVVHSAVEATRPMIDEHAHMLEEDVPAVPLWADADFTRLSQALSNLLNNAAKYTPNGGQITLRAEQRGTHVVVSVRDNGAGIRAEVLGQVFDPFVQGERSYSRSKGGLGIGLTLARSIVLLHGGTIEARSAGLGQGSEFVVHLPLPPPSAETRSIESRRPATRIAGQRILVVDDNIDAAESLGALLRCLGADVVTVHDGPAALEALRTEKASAAVLDIGMPGMDGYEVARRVRSGPRGNDIKLIALTGWGNDEDRRRSREAGIDHHLVKPVDLHVLEDLLAARRGEPRPANLH